MLEGQEEMRMREKLYSGRGRKRWKEISSSGIGKFMLREVLDLGVELSTKYRGKFRKKKKTGENALTRKENLNLLEKGKGKLLSLSLEGN